MRSDVMRAVKSRDTHPELLVRKLLHAMGLRFRLHRKDLPGSPDIVLAGRKMAIFVHGCFWHGHDCSRGARVPKTNSEYWKAKIRRNLVRDERAAGELMAQGWRVLIIWQCELKVRDRASLVQRLESALWTESEPNLTSRISMHGAPSAISPRTQRRGHEPSASVERR